MNIKFSTLCFLVLCALTALSAAKIRVNTETRHMVDENNRTRIYHGVNVVYKVMPFYPQTDSFDPLLSLCERDLADLNKWGLNYIRLHMSWEAFQPTPETNDFDYFRVLQKIIRMAAKYNISVLLDVHQDLLNRKFCGEGVPDWAVTVKNFPYPTEATLEYDEKGYPTTESCLRTHFPNFYFSEDISRTFEEFYSNKNNIADKFGEYWQKAAKFFKDEPNVIGYEIINEPWFGDIYSNWWSGLQPGYADYYGLQPFYRKIHEYIRKEDNETIIYFEPSIFQFLAVGFTEGPGGPEYNDRQILSYHIYCGMNNDMGDPKDVSVCSLMDKEILYKHIHAAKKLGLATFVTEFGSVSNRTEGIDELLSVTAMMDENFQSWAYWQFKWYHDFTSTTHPATAEGFYDADGSLINNKLDTMSRPYFYAICGVPTKFAYNYTTRDFEFKFNHTLDSECLNEFYLPQVYFDVGFDIVFTENGALGSLSQLTPNHFGLKFNNFAKNTIVGVKITLKKSKKPKA